MNPDDADMNSAQTFCNREKPLAEGPMRYDFFMPGGRSKTADEIVTRLGPIFKSLSYPFASKGESENFNDDKRI
jgi:hypothetical protein